MNRTFKTITSVAAAAMLSLSMLQTAQAASWNYSSRYPTKYSTTSHQTTTTTTNRSTTSTATKSTGTQSAASSSGSSESQMISLVNQDRGKAGLKALQSDSSLHAGALKHSQDMATHSFFSHTSPANGTFAQRASASGARVSAENIALNGSVAGAEASFMGSDGHRANILNPNYTRVGVGIVYSSSRGAYYITQWFGR